MKYNPEIHKRRTIRLKEYDYSKNGAYFVTVCSFNRNNIFSEILEGCSNLNEAGEIVKKEWLNNAVIRNNVILDEYIIMPNHIHGIIFIDGIGSCNSLVEGRMQYAPTLDKTENKLQSPAKTLGSVIRGFKAVTTKNIRLLTRDISLTVWQKNYYERIIRNEEELNNIRQYIINNPAKWETDNLNPINEKF